MQDRRIRALVAAGLIVAFLWGVTEMVSNPVEQDMTAIVIVAVIFLFTIIGFGAQRRLNPEVARDPRQLEIVDEKDSHLAKGRFSDAPIGVRIALFLVFGYFIGGKGFAYLTPAPPVYIGEVGLLALAGIAVLRGPLSGVFSTTMLNSLSVIGVLAFGLLAVSGAFDHGILAIRDYAAVYYTLFIPLAYVAFADRSGQRVFAKFLPYAFLGGVLAWGTQMLDVAGAIQSAIVFYNPHPDSLVPILGSASVTLLHLGVTKKSSVSLMCGIVCLLMMAVSGKSAFIFSFGCVCLVFATVGRMRFLWVSGGGALAMMGLLYVLHLGGGNALTSRLFEGDLAKTIGAVSGELEGDSAGGTTGWRINWWRSVYDETMAINPLLGQGFGADLTGPFLQDYMGRTADEAAKEVEVYARYPHCILFTAFGRCGFFGVMGFIIFSTALLKFTYNYIRRFVVTKNAHFSDVLVSGYIVAGFANAFVQATFEVPYVAVTFFILLGYMIRRYFSYSEVNATPVLRLVD